MADRLELEARFNDHASAGVKRLGKTLEAVRPSNGMEQAQKWMGNFRTAADKANVAVRPITGTLTALGVGGLAASMSMSELVRQIKGLSDGALNMRELSRQSRISMGDLQRLQYVATKFHMDPAAVDGVLAGWSDKMLDFRKHTGDFYNELMRQNQDVAAKIQADSPVEALKDTLDFLSRIKDPALQRRWADSMNLGGLVPMLGKGPQGLAEAFADAGREVKPITQAMVEAADRLNASTARMTQSWTNLKNDIGPSVIDPLSHVIDRLDETLKFAAAHPGDAAAVAGVGALSAAALFARRRIMAGSKIAGGTGLDRAAGELTGAAEALKQAAAALEGSKGVPGSGVGEGGKPGGGSFDKGRGLFAALGLAGAVVNAPGMDEAGDRERDANASALESFGDAARKVLGVDWLTRKLDELRGGSSGKFEHPDDDRLSRARPDDLQKEVREGSRAGIIAGLREMAQQQELDGKGGGNGGDGGPGGTLGAASRVLGKASIAAGARPRAGGGFTAATGGGTTRAGGSLAANQKEAYAAALKEGLNPTAARALVANMSGEGLGNPKDYHWDSTHMASGIVQWDPTRSAAIKAKFGAMPHQLSVADQTKAAIWEMKTRPEYAASWKALQGDNAAEMIGALVDNYERPKLRALPKAQRMGYYRGFNPDAQQTPGAGTPAPSSAAVGDAAMFAAKQRLLNGGRDPADKALVERYKAQQAKPEGHRAGGWIRGAGTGTSDSIPAWLSHGEFVVRAGAAKHWGALLHAINGGHLPAYADGGEVDAGAARRRSWLSFFQRAPGAGGMGASRSVALGATAMMQGESGRGLNPNLYGWDVNGPSGGTAQWHDVTLGKYAGRLHRLSDLMAFAMGQHADWHDVPVQQAWWKREATGPLAGAWRAMRLAKTAAGTLKQGIDKFENPAQHDLEFARRMPNIARLVRESGGGDTRVAHEIDPIQVDIRHHPHTGHPIVQARVGKGVRLGIKTAPMMRPT